MGRVNVRTLASVHSGQVIQIRNAGTEVEVNAEVLNSAGETWYAVKLYSGYTGYIRADLLRVDIEPVRAAVPEPAASVQESSESSVIIYVVVDESILESGVEPKIVYVTPEQAAEIGIG